MWGRDRGAGDGPSSRHAASGAQALLGLATLVLGTLALSISGAGILVLVALLAVGALLLLTSAAVAGAALSIARLASAPQGSAADTPPIPELFHALFSD